MKMAEIASRINAHLKRFEADPEINQYKDSRRFELHPYWRAMAVHSGRYIAVVYISYQGARHLTKPQAERYLEWLDAGNNGYHYEAI